MKKFFVLLICIAMLFIFTFSISSMDIRIKLDMRELEAYGQQHFYLGDPLDEANAPNATDGKVSQDEYAVTYEYRNGDKCAVLSDKAAAAKIVDNECVRVYLAYDAEHLYIAVETEDANYIKGRDGVGINIGFRDAGRPVDAISRYCFDIYSHANSIDGDITTLNAKCRYFNKLDNGEWSNEETQDASIYIDDSSVCYDDKAGVATYEVKFELYHLLKEAGNDLPLNDIRIYFAPFVYMYGESQKGAGDVVRQGVLWSYLPSTYISELKTQFALDYPEATYWSSMVPNIIHLTSDPAHTTVTTEAPADTDENTSTTTVVTFSQGLTTEPITEVTTASADPGGCKGETALSLTSLIGILSVFLIKHKKED